MEEMEHRKGNVHQSCEGWSLMIRPLEVSNSVLKLGIIVESIANIDDEVLVCVLIV